MDRIDHASPRASPATARGALRVIGRGAMRVTGRGAMRLIGAAIFLLVTSAGLCGPQVPEPDLCTEPGNPSITALQLGAATLNEVFVPWQPDQRVPVVIGGQGSPMIAMRIRIQGDDAGCVAQMTRLVPAEGELLASERHLLHAYRQDDGSYITNTHWLVMDAFGFPAEDVPAMIETTIGATTVSQTIVLSR
jgi:hypothetical protein